MQSGFRGRPKVHDHAWHIFGAISLRTSGEFYISRSVGHNVIYEANQRGILNAMYAKPEEVARGVQLSDIDGISVLDFPREPQGTWKWEREYTIKDVTTCPFIVLPNGKPGVMETVSGNNDDPPRARAIELETVILNGPDWHYGL